MPRTRRSDPAGPGLARVGRGKGFSYHGPAGERVNDPAVIKRIKALVIPPAWKNVWICEDDRGHIQATGIDAAGRKQYLYHEDWRQNRDREKFERIEEFAKAMPSAREALEADLALRGLVRERVLACGVRLLDIGMFRIGSEEYEEENETFGLATMRKEHVRVTKKGLSFDYVAKGGIERTQLIEDRMVTATVVALKRRKGTQADPLLAYKGPRGEVWHDVSSVEVNDWLKALIGEDFSAKDFRTWNATVLAAMNLAGRSGAKDQAAAITQAVEEVAAVLGNTPAVCRESYIDPRVIDAFGRGKTIKRALASLSGDGFADRERIEAAVLRLVA
jgi:DNA topoisomerase-1